VQGLEPDFSFKGAAGQQMVHCFHLLVTVHAAGVIMEIMLPGTLRGLVPPMEHKPQEKMAFVGGFGFPQLFGAQELRLTYEHGAIS
jgi:hypothetical protein